MSGYDYHSGIGAAAWAEVLRLLRDREVSGLKGTPRMKIINGRGYWYDHYRIGSETVDRYIGEDGAELRSRLDRYGEMRARDQRSARERARLMRVLQAEGYLMSDVGTGQIVSAMARAGVFRLGGTLVGTQAFRAYEGLLGVRIGFDQSAMTDDIDVASFERLSLVLDDRLDEPLAGVFSDLKFEPLPSVDRDGRVWRWRQTDRQTLVEFLTPSFSEEEGVRELAALGVSAQSLHFLNYLIAEPVQVPFLYRSGVLVQVPRPERYAIHKLIVADRRRDGPDALKSRKDRAQAAFLIGVLAGERPEDLVEAWEEARGRGAAWRARIAASLRRMPETREVLRQVVG
ncbi:nucleotidyltransferase family protein [Amaricoccus tamworthensis]|uniref:nucleotidyltransferase family protein n=1 Tax=Amaricoccus tamworthensis TaxID=57002 RepID=UPI003C7AC990